MGEGSALHASFKAMEIEVPSQEGLSNPELRLKVCGVPTRGRIDWLNEDRIEDLKTKTPYWGVNFGNKEKGIKPYAYIWEPKDDSDDIKGWQIQLSIYRVLLEKSGQRPPVVGRVWRRYSGVKSDQPRWKRYDFPLLDEVGLERLVGDWMRGLQDGLSASQNDAEAWRTVAADGRGMVGSKGNYWQCDRCQLKDACFKQDALEIF